MGKSMMTIHKEIEKKKHTESPLGKTEKRLREIYSIFERNKMQLPEDLSKKIYDLRDENEKWQMDYIARTNLEHKRAVDEKLLETLSNELTIWEEFLKANTKALPEIG